jgi:hypothetical protein
VIWQWIAAATVALCATTAHAEVPEYTLTIRDHRFEPARLVIPAGTKVRLRVLNSDPGAEEFESHELNREKVIAGGASVSIFVGPLEPGHYPFFGEFNPDTAQGVLIAE